MHPSLQGLSNPSVLSRVSAQGCEGATGAPAVACSQRMCGRYRSPVTHLYHAPVTGALRWLQARPLQEHCAGCWRCRYRSTALAAGAAATGGLRWLQVQPLQEHSTGCRRGATGALRWLQARPLQEHCAGCRHGRYRSMPYPCSSRTTPAPGCRRGRYRSTALAAGAVATGALRWLQARPLQGACAGCRCGRYRGTPLAAGAAATGALHWLQARPLQEHSACAGGWCLLQGYGIPL